MSATTITAPIPRIHPYIAIGIGISGASFAAIFIKLAQDTGMHSVMISAARLILATALLTPLVLRRYRLQLSRLTRSDLMWSAFAGFWMGMHFILIITSLEYTSIIINQVIVNTGPIWTAIIELVFLKTHISKLLWLGIFVALVGGCVIGLASMTETQQQPADEVLVYPVSNQASLIGAGLALVGAGAGAIYMVIGRKVRVKVSLIPYIWLVFGWGAITCSLAALIFDVPFVGYSLTSYFWLLMLTLVTQLIGHGSFNYALGYLSATVVSLSGQVIAVVSSIIAIFVFSQFPSPLDLIGSAIIISGVVIAIIAQNQRPVKSSP